MGSVDSSKSRYVHGGTTEVSTTHLEYWDRKKILPDMSDDTYVLEHLYEGKPHLLSSVMYGDSRLWWVICQVNHILDINEEFVEGKVLIIPSKERIMREIMNGKKGGVDSKRIQKPTMSKIIV